MEVSPIAERTAGRPSFSPLFLFRYGTTLAIVKRLCKDGTAYLQSTPSDWAFLVLMWLSGVTGFLLEIAVYLPQAYAILLLAGYRTWGLCGGPPTPARWWPGAKRWSFNTLWRSYRSELWNKEEFQPLSTRTGDDWWKKEAWLTGLDNAVSAATRI